MPWRCRKCGVVRSKPFREGSLCSACYAKQEDALLTDKQRRKLDKQFEELFGKKPGYYATNGTVTGRYLPPIYSTSKPSRTLTAEQEEAFKTFIAGGLSLNQMRKLMQLADSKKAEELLKETDDEDEAPSKIKVQPLHASRKIRIRD